MIRLGSIEAGECRGLGRREVIQVGAAGALGLALPQLVAAQPADRRLSVLCVFLRGGVSHIDTWDVKPEATAAEARGEFKPIPTSVAGLQFCELLPLLARQAHHLNVLHGASHSEGEHDRAMQWVLTGYPSTNPRVYPNPGAILGKYIPSTNSLPPAIHVQTPGIGNPQAPPSPASQPGIGAGFFGAGHQPFMLTDPLKLDETDWLRPGPIVADRLDRRQAILQGIDRMQRRFDSCELGDQHTAAYQRAFSIVSSPEAKKAFRLDDEPDALRDQYGRHEFGQSCLLGRRLIEAGVRYVQVNWSARGWDAITKKDDLFTRSTFDSHFGHFPWLRRQLPRLDQGLATLMADLHQRGTLEKTLVVVLTEFGRTVGINGDGGRDHWPQAFSVLIGGGGIPCGRRIGATNDNGMEITDGRFEPQSLLNSIYTLCGLDVSVGLRQAGITGDNSEGVPGLI